jgi:hypothetical protein
MKQWDEKPRMNHGDWGIVKGTIVKGTGQLTTKLYWTRKMSMERGF